MRNFSNHPCAFNFVSSKLSTIRVGCSAHGIHLEIFCFSKWAPRRFDYARDTKLKVDFNGSPLFKPLLTRAKFCSSAHVRKTTKITRKCMSMDGHPQRIVRIFDGQESSKNAQGRFVRNSSVSYRWCESRGCRRGWGEAGEYIKDLHTERFAILEVMYYNIRWLIAVYN